MRCLACNCVLTDKEATRRYASDGSFVDLCDNDIDPEILTMDSQNDDDGEEEIEEAE